MKKVSRPARRILALVLVGSIAASARSDESRVAASLQPFVDAGTLAGAVTLAATPDEVLSLEAVGFSDIAARTPMRTDALFWIASQTKPMTAAALMMLVDEGKVRLDAPVETYLPEFRGQMMIVENADDRLVLKRPTHPITVREILSHTAGLVGRSPLEGTLDSLSLREGTITYALSPLKFEPGTRFEYCNPGLNTAGRLIEVVSGTPYETFMSRRLFEPLGMTDTTFWPTADQLKRLAKSYAPGPENTGLVETTITQLKYPLTDRARHPYPAGGLFSTAADVARFCQMILNGGTYQGKRYVSETSVRAMTSTQTGDLLNAGQGEQGYGLGWSTSRKSRGEDGPVIPGHCNHGGAYSTNMTIDPGRKRITVFMVQHAGFPGGAGGKIQQAFVKAVDDVHGTK